MAENPYRSPRGPTERADVSQDALVLERPALLWTARGLAVLYVVMIVSVIVDFCSLLSLVSTLAGSGSVVANPALLQRVLSLVDLVLILASVGSGLCFLALPRSFRSVLLPMVACFGAAFLLSALTTMRPLALLISPAMRHASGGLDSIGCLLSYCFVTQLATALDRPAECRRARVLTFWRAGLLLSWITNVAIQAAYSGGIVYFLFGSGERLRLPTFWSHRLHATAVGLRWSITAVDFVVTIFGAILIGNIRAAVVQRTAVAEEQQTTESLPPPSTAASSMPV